MIRGWVQLIGIRSSDTLGTKDTEDPTEKSLYTPGDS